MTYYKGAFQCALLNSFRLAQLFQALLVDVLLQPGYLLSGELDSTSEGEIIPFSGVSKSGAGCIIQAGGAGGGLLRAGGVELQPALANSNVIMQLIDSRLSIS